MTGVLVRVLGPLAVEYQGRQLPLGCPQNRAVLSLLTVHRDEVVSTERLIEGMWGRTPPRSARALVQNRVCRLRAVLRPDGPGGVTLETIGRGYRLRIPLGGLDLDVFRDALAAAETQVRLGMPSLAAGVLRGALAGWRDRPYADVHLPLVREAAERLATLRLVAVERWLAAELAAGDGSDVLHQIIGLVDEHPFHERFRAHLMTVLSRCGRVAEALAVYRDGRTRLADELGVEPSPELQHLHQEILRGEVRTGRVADGYRADRAGCEARFGGTPPPLGQNGNGRSVDRDLAAQGW